VVGASRSNSVYIFNGASSGLANSPSITISGSGYFGASVAVGSVFSNNFTDLVIGAPSAGTIYLYQGGLSGILSTATTTYGSGGTSNFGISLAIGTFYYDGYGDIAVGSNQSPGSVAVLKGTGTGVTVVGTGSLTGTVAETGLGSSVCFANLGIGSNDFIIGAPMMDIYNQNNAIIGNPGGIYTLGFTQTNVTATLGTAGPISGSNYGSAVSALDLSNSGIYNLAVGASGIGTVYIYPAGQATYTTPILLVDPSGIAAYGFGYSIDH